jgi:folate-binding protein YgfZ
VSFLHGQLTQDVEHLSPGIARWAGFCSPKGRLMSTFRLWRDDSALFLSVARPLAAPIAKRLSMFVLRAKARVVNASDAWACFGLAGDAAAQAGAQWLGCAVPQADAAACALGSDGLARGHLVGLPAVTVPATDAPLPRWLLVVPADQATEVWGRLTAVSSPMSGLAWRHAEVLSAVPRIVPATQELFVPQMINFESVDGVNFRKGCYPGQEVVARSQYLGKLKRRMFLAHGLGVEPAPGSDVLPASGGEPCGQVVLAAADGAGGFDVLFEARTEALDAGAPRTVDGTVLTVRALPYALKSID